MSLRSQSVVVVALAVAVVLTLPQTAMAQGGGRVVGQVFDEYGEPMEGVTITVDATDPELRPPQFVTTTDSCLLYTSPSPRDGLLSRMPSSA